MNLSFFSVTIIYIAFLLYVHYKLKDLEITGLKNNSLDFLKIGKPKEIDTIISLDDIDDVDLDTFKDLEKFLATTDIKEGFEFNVNMPALKETDVYYDSNEEPLPLSETMKKEIIESINKDEEEEEPLNNIQGFDVFGSHNFSPL